MRIRLSRADRLALVITLAILALIFAVDVKPVQVIYSGF